MLPLLLWAVAVAVVLGLAWVYGRSWRAVADTLDDVQVRVEITLPDHSGVSTEAAIGGSNRHTLSA
jgi:hypothetical protein